MVLFECKNSDKIGIRLEKKGLPLSLSVRRIQGRSLPARWYSTYGNASDLKPNPFQSLAAHLSIFLALSYAIDNCCDAMHGCMGNTPLALARF